MKQKWIAVAAFFSFFMTFSSLSAAQTQEMDTITVVDYWVHQAGSFTLGGGGAGGGVALSEEATIQMAMERIARSHNGAI